MHQYARIKLFWTHICSIVELKHVNKGFLKVAAAIFTVLLVQNAYAQDAVLLTKGMVIDRSILVEPQQYHIAADSSGAISIVGNNIEVDFQGAELIGSVSSTEQSSSIPRPDLFDGTGIRVEGSNITIRNLKVRGYKIGIWATKSTRLRITNSDLSYNYRQRLKSTIEREHIDDWMSYHQNENDEWMRFGAAIYVRDADSLMIDSVTVSGGQNGVMLTNVNHSVIVANSITFNSGIGVGLYRSSHNKIQHNRLDWNVRGYSHGVYNRGQDSAALLLYEQSNDNSIAYNSATHSGDGLFLWAGQSTMDTGEGGANDNMIYGNDFSFAPTNGIEVTFSRNVIINNKIHGCWHGIWGGYSYNTAILGNDFAGNAEHIAIEHGQRITIEDNQFTGGEIGLRIWERESQPADWGYSKNRNVDSEKYVVAGNRFTDVLVPIDVSQTDGLNVRGNSFNGSIKTLRVVNSTSASFKFNAFSSFNTPSELIVEGDGVVAVENLFGTDRAKHLSGDPTRYAPDVIAGLDVPEIPSNQLTGRKSMRIDEWGPYDYLSPAFWPAPDRDERIQHLSVLGPHGEWKLVETAGVDSVSQTSGQTGDSIHVWLSQSRAVDINLVGEFVGEQVVDRFGSVTEKGSPFRFAYEYFHAPIDWQINFFNYDDSTDPRTNAEGFETLLSESPAYSEATDALAYQWYGAPNEAVSADHFATVAEGSFEVPTGEYWLDLTSDDGVRVWIDDELVHDDWTYHPPRQALIPLELGGRHSIRVQHFEIDGYSTVEASLKRRLE